jgi:uracil-DNA glycosylase family 4
VLTGGNDPLREAQSLLDWWQLAGVEWDFADSPNNWLADDAPMPERIMPAASAARSVQPASSAAPQARAEAPAPRAPLALPDTLEAFQSAWAAGTLAADGGDGRHVAPTGAQGARLMVLTGAPERDDEQVILSGRSGRLIDNIARVCGFAPEEIYRASLFPRLVLDNQAALPHLPIWTRIAQHHIGLVAPQMLVVAGEDTARALLKHDPSQKLTDLYFLNHGGRTVKTVVTRKLSLMFHRIAQEKGMAWKQWQLLLVE